MLLSPIPWAGRVWALPFLTVLAPSERYYENRPGKHKKITDWARQMLLQLHRWLPDRKLIITADSTYCCYELLDAVRSRMCMITRLRLDARLFDFPLPRPKGPPRSARHCRNSPSYAIWYKSGMPAVPCRWVLIKDPEGQLHPINCFALHRFRHLN